MNGSALGRNTIAKYAESKENMGCKTIVIETGNVVDQSIRIHMIDKNGDSITERLFSCPNTAYNFKMSAMEMMAHVKTFMSHFQTDNSFEPIGLDKSIPILIPSFVDARFHSYILKLGHPVFILSGLHNTFKDYITKADRENLVDYIERKNKSRAERDAKMLETQIHINFRNRKRKHESEVGETRAEQQLQQ